MFGTASAAEDLDAGHVHRHDAEPDLALPGRPWLCLWVDPRPCTAVESFDLAGDEDAPSTRRRRIAVVNFERNWLAPGERPE